MRHILVVDDRPEAERDLQSLFAPQRADWEVVFAADGASAVAALDDRRFDAVVADVDGTPEGRNLLEAAKARHPQTVRLALTAQPELVRAMRTVPIAHQALARPCSSDELREVVDRITSVIELVHGDTLRAVVGEVDTLPALPETYGRLTALLEDPTVGLREVGEVVERDVAVTAKLLQLVNSAFFGLPRRVTNVQSAISYLGMTVVRNLVLSLSVFSSFASVRVPGFSLDAVQENSFAVATVAQHLCDDPEVGEDAFAAGLLADVGTLVLATRLPEYVYYARKLAAQRSVGRHVIEADPTVELGDDLHGGTTHAQVGAYLLGLWGLPVSIVEAVAQHHTAPSVVHSTFDAMDAVYVAHRLVQRHAPFLADPDDVDDPIDPDYLARLGVLERLPEWSAWVERKADA